MSEERGSLDNWFCNDTNAWLAHPLHGYGCCEYIKPRQEFETKDSGERVDFPSGMRRDTNKGKLRFDLIPLSMLKRLAGLYARGAEKYGDNNYLLADSEEELARFKESAWRHFVQWLEGERDEDHAMAVAFNIFAAELVQEKLSSQASK